MNCRHSSITRKTIPNRKNQEKSTVLISEILNSTVKIVVGYGSDTRNSKFNRKECGEGMVPTPEALNLTVGNAAELRFGYQKNQIQP